MNFLNKWRKKRKVNGQMMTNFGVLLLENASSNTKIIHLVTISIIFVWLFCEVYYKIIGLAEK